MIGVLGLGVTGISVVKLLNFLNKEIVIFNKGEAHEWKNLDKIKSLKNFEKFILLSDETPLFAYEKLECLILSPGIPRTHPIVSKVLSSKIPIFSEIEFALKFLKSKVLAITGSNGKTTTVSLLSFALEKAGKKVFLGGNIGTPLADLALEVLQNPAKTTPEYIVLELSSFQLESMGEAFIPHLAAITNFSRTHMERYNSLESYAAAKANIVNKMSTSQICFLPEQDSYLNQLIKKRVNVYTYDAKEKIQNLKKELNLDNFQLLGEHNLKNLALVYAFFQELKIPLQGLQLAVNEFQNAPHRIQKVQEDVYNDSKSSNWESTLVALKTLFQKKKKIYLILGGSLRNKDELGISEDLVKQLNLLVYKILLVGETSDILKNEFTSQFDLKIPMEKVETLENAIHLFKKERSSEKNLLLLLSPAFPSFDQFDNYEHRGKVFISLTEKIL